jgi:hypothetical protein
VPLLFAVPVASPDPLANVISALGMPAVLAWVAWRFGPTLTRLAGWCLVWLAWACGSQGGYGCCAAFGLLGALVWAGGTIWYARRRGRWPSTLSAKLVARLPGERRPRGPVQLPSAVAPRQRR